MTNVLGIDIGGSGIKGALVDLASGELASSRVRIDTPRKSTPKNCAVVLEKILDCFEGRIGDRPIGITVPAPVVHGRIPMIANLDKAWTNLPAQDYFSDVLDREVVVMNDADAAGLAEVYYGAAKDQPGVVIVTTLGTGIGTAIIHNGVLLPNCELGHLELDGHDAESRASAGYMERTRMGYRRWAKRLNRYYQHLEMLFWPDLFVVGGGVSRDHDQFLPLLELRTKIVPAHLRNQAGIVGAAWMAVNHRTQDPVGPAKNG